MGRSAAIKLVSDTSTMVLGIVASIVTARALGPAGRGSFAVLLLLISVFSAIGSLGLSDALVYLRGRLNVGTRLLAGVFPMGFIASLIAALLLMAVAKAQLASGTDTTLAVLLAGATVPPTVVQLIAIGALNANNETIRTSQLMLLQSVLLTSFLVIGLTTLDSTVPTAFIAVFLASMLTLVMAIRAVMHSGLWASPRLDTKLSAVAVRYGLLTMVGSLLIQITARADLLVIVHLIGNASAGQYSIALTVGGLVGGIAVSLSFASFPVLTTARDEVMWELTTMMCRGAILLAVLLATAVAVTSPVLVPTVFGGEYEPAVAPAVFMLIGGVLSTPQWIIARARAAAGRPSRLLISYGLSTICMLTADFILIPHLGLVGGAIAAIFGVSAGLTYSVIEFHGAHTKSWRDFPDLVPTRKDAAHTLALVKALLKGWRSGPDRSGDRV